MVASAAWDRLASHLAAHSQAAAARGPLCASLLSAELRVRELLEPLRGREFAPRPGLTISVPAELDWRLTSTSGGLLIAFAGTGPRVRTKAGPLHVAAECTGVLISLTRVTLQLARFPDFDLDIDWR